MKSQTLKCTISRSEILLMVRVSAAHLVTLRAAETRLIGKVQELG
jgi:hypothetical protein